MASHCTIQPAVLPVHIGVEPRHVLLADAAEVGQAVEEHLVVEAAEVGRAEVLARGPMDGCGVVGQAVEVERGGDLGLLGLARGPSWAAIPARPSRSRWSARRGGRPRTTLLRARSWW